MVGDVGADPDIQALVATVVIPYYDAAETLGLQLRALAHQDGAPAFEVLVVDNMSPTPPDAVVAPFGSDLDVRIVRAPERQGVSAARNVGVREARTDRIVFCDADDCVGPRFVASAVEALQMGDIVTGQAVPMDASLFDGGLEAVWEALADRVESGQPRTGLVDPHYPIIMGGASAATRAALLALDGFDQAFFPGAEDNDLALRAVAAGYDIVTAPEMTLAERRRASSGMAFARSRDAGEMHIKLCAAHDLWGRSPHLHEPTWWVDLGKAPLSAVKMARRPARDRDWWGLSARTGLRVGQAVGMWRMRVLRRPVRRELGVGLRPTPSSHA